jgi:hypothetical protein
MPQSKPQGRAVVPTALIIGLAGENGTILARLTAGPEDNGSGTITSTTAYVASKPTQRMKELISTLDRGAKIDAGTEYVLQSLLPNLEKKKTWCASDFPGVLLAGQGRMYVKASEFIVD